MWMLGFLAQTVEIEHDLRQFLYNALSHRIWILLTPFWIKYNLAYSWDKQTNLVAVSWLLRNHIGKVLLHSRHVVAGIGSLAEANLQLWAINSMSNLTYLRLFLVLKLLNWLVMFVVWKHAPHLHSKLQRSIWPYWIFKNGDFKQNQLRLIIVHFSLFKVLFGSWIHSYITFGFLIWLKKTR